MKTKILRNIFLSVGVLFALARLLAAAMSSILLLGILAPGVSGGHCDGVQCVSLAVVAFRRF
jgi:hypothetical protein